MMRPPLLRRAWRIIWNSVFMQSHSKSRDSRQAAPIPHGKEGEDICGMETGTPTPDGFQATRWQRRIRNAPGAMRGTDASPSTRVLHHRA